MRAKVHCSWKEPNGLSLQTARIRDYGSTTTSVLERRRSILTLTR